MIVAVAKIVKKKKVRNIILKPVYHYYKNILSKLH